MGEPAEKKVVVCDDQVDFGYIIRRALEKRGFAVLLASNGVQGLELVRAEHPVVLILDINMPLKGGIEVLEDLRAEGLTLSVLILSSHESPEMHEKVRSLGARDVMVKPFALPELVQRVEALAAGSA